jgi:hypothetical protein
MGIRINFQTIVIKKSSVEKCYRDGVEAFRAKYPFAAEDPHLFGLASMSGGELGELIAEITDSGLECGVNFATGEMFHGEMDRCPDILFEQTGAGPFARWEARLIKDDPDIMAREGARLYAKIMERGWVLDIPSSET